MTFGSARCGFLLLSLLAAIPLQAQQGADLTGDWQDDIGGRYQIRQVGSAVAWLDDQMPTVKNVFVGSLSGDTLSGQWYDLPGGRILNSGSLSLRVESSNRMVRVFSSAHYGGSVLTRLGTSTSGGGPGGGGGGCDLSGTWRQRLGSEGTSTWTFTPLGGGRYSGQEQGLGNVSGTAVVTGSSLRIDWATPDGAHTGINELTLDPGCGVANGKVTFTRGRSDVVALRLERTGGGVATCDISGSWREQLGSEGTSTWTFTPLGGGRYSGEEQGLGNVRGTAVLTGSSLRIDWATPDGAYTGINELTLDGSCNVANGKVTFTRGRSDAVALRLERTGPPPSR